MALTCFNQHESISSLFISIELESAAAGGRTFTHQQALAGSHTSAGPLTHAFAAHQAGSPSDLAHAISSRQCKVGPRCGVKLPAGIYSQITASLFHFLSSQPFVERGSTSPRPGWVLSAAEFAFQDPHTHAHSSSHSSVDIYLHTLNFKVRRSVVHE